MGVGEKEYKRRVKSPIGYNALDCICESVIALFGMRDVVFSNPSYFLHLISFIKVFTPISLRQLTFFIFLDSVYYWNLDHILTKTFKIWNMPPQPSNLTVTVHYFPRSSSASCKRITKVYFKFRPLNFSWIRHNYSWKYTTISYSIWTEKVFRFLCRLKSH